MKHLYSWILLVVIFLISISFAATATAGNNDTIRVVLHPKFPPYSFLNSHGEFEGYDVDLLKAITRRLNRPYKIIPGNRLFGSQALKQHQIDLVFRKSDHIDEEDTAMVYGTLNTYAVHSLVVKKKSTLRSEHDLRGKTVAVVKNSTPYFYLQENEHNYALLLCDDYEEALRKVSGGKADGAILNLYTARYLLKYNPEFADLHSRVSSMPPIPYYLATYKENELLLKQLKKVQVDMERDGEYDELYDHFLVTASGKDYSNVFLMLSLVIFWSILVALATYFIYQRREKKQKSIISRKENTMQTSREDWENFMMNIGVPISISDAEDECKVIYQNKMARDQERSSKVKVDWTKTSMKEIVEKSDYFDHVVHETHEPVTFHIQLVMRKDGKVVYVMCSKYPILLNEKSYVLSTFVNITEIQEEKKRLKEMNRLMKEASDKAEQLEKLKSAFLANMSHEIRTPMNAIEGFSAMLADAPDVESRHMYSGIIANNIALLLKLLEDMLDLSKLESKTFVLEPSPIDAVAILHEKYAIFKDEFEEAKLAFDLKLGGVKKADVVFDANRLMQILNNFLSNALKFTHEGKVTLGIEEVEQGFKIYVKDTGIGIPADKQSIIGTRFGKVNAFKQGMGLGLTICKAIMQEAGGEFGFKSKEGKGSTFWIIIPKSGSEGGTEGQVAQ